MFTINTDPTNGTVTYDLRDLLDQAAEWVAVAERYSQTARVGVDHAHAAEFLGRAEAIILIMPLSMDDRCWNKYHNVQARARAVLATLKDVAWQAETGRPRATEF
jgi:hypothetical protein